LEDVEDKKASELGFEEEVSANDLLKELSGDKVSSLADFINAGGELWVGDEKVTSGTTKIKPTDTVTIVAPKDDDKDDEDDDNKGGKDDGELEEKFNDKASELGVTKEVSVDNMIKNAENIPFSSLDEFIKAGAELYLNDKKVILGTTKIKPNDTVKILAPKDEDDKDDEGDDNKDDKYDDDKDDGGKDDNTDGNGSGSGDVPSKLVGVWYMDTNNNGTPDIGDASYEFKSDGKIMMMGKYSGYTFQVEDSNTFVTYLNGTKLGPVDWVVSGNTLTVAASPLSGIASGKYVKE
jgi:hypothetical protein